MSARSITCNSFLFKLVKVRKPARTRVSARLTSTAMFHAPQVVPHEPDDESRKQKRYNSLANPPGAANGFGGVVELVFVEQ